MILLGYISKSKMSRDIIESLEIAALLDVSKRTFHTIVGIYWKEKTTGDLLENGSLTCYSRWMVNHHIMHYLYNIII